MYLQFSNTLINEKNAGRIKYFRGPDVARGP
jgi:hypothetical protein